MSSSWQMNRAATKAPIRWPEGKTFAFTVFDDPDAQTLKEGQQIYSFLAGLGLRTTKGVWPSGPVRETNSPGDTCQDPAYLKAACELQRLGFEIGYHHNTPHTSLRSEIIEGLDRFRSYFGGDPLSMANHYNGEAIYWGSARLTGLSRAVYNCSTLWQNEGKFNGHVNGHPSFWGDVCKSRIRYCRNFIFLDINTLKACPWMPYHDPLRPFVNLWYASTEGSNRDRFVKTICEENQDRLEAEGGACIMYTHFGHHYVRDGSLDPEFQRLMTRLSRKNGWFVPVSTLLGYLRSQQGDTELTGKMRRDLEIRWLWVKFFRGTS